MTVIGEIRDAVAMLSDGVQQMRKLVDALNDGCTYLQSKHPDAQPDLARLLRQMNVTITGLISAAETITSIDFTLDGPARDTAPAEFNKELKKANAKREKHENSLSKLHGSCTRMEEISARLDARANNRPWWALLGDKGGQQAQTLSATFGQLFFWDQRMVEQARQVLAASQKALEEVRETLQARPGVAGMSIENVDAAAEVLWRQQAELRPQVSHLKTLRDDVADLISGLDPKGATADETNKKR